LRISYHRGVIALENRFAGRLNVEIGGFHDTLEDKSRAPLKYDKGEFHGDERRFSGR
jgi:hypothetical protein